MPDLPRRLEARNVCHSRRLSWFDLLRNRRPALTWARWWYGQESACSFIGVYKRLHGCENMTRHQDSLPTDQARADAFNAAVEVMEKEGAAT